MPRFVSERPGPQHDLSEFDCGSETLNGWLVDHAAHAQAMRTAQTFVWHPGDGRVVAYYSLAAHLLVRADLPRRVGRGSPSEIPAVLLARLALAAQLQGQGLGGELIWDALTSARAAAEIAAARFVLVDAIDRGAAEFYEHHGFTPVEGDPNRLVQRLSDVAAALDAAG